MSDEKQTADGETPLDDGPEDRFERERLLDALAIQLEVCPPMPSELRPLAIALVTALGDLQTTQALLVKRVAAAGTLEDGILMREAHLAERSMAILLEYLTRRTEDPAKKA